MNKLLQIITKRHGKETQTKNTVSSNVIDEEGTIIDKRIEEEVNRKVDWYYVYNILCSARSEVKSFQLYKRKIAEVNTALEEDDIERAIDAMYFDEAREIPPDPLEEELKRYSSNTVIPPMVSNTPEEKKAEARKVYQEKGILGFQKLVWLELEIHMKSKSIDGLLQKAEDELNRIEEIVNNNPPNSAHRQLYLTGACHFEWELKKSILKTDYGIDWKTPAERFPDICFD